MPMPQRSIRVAYLAGALAVLLWIGCRGDAATLTAEDHILARIEEAEDYAEQRDRDGLLGLVSDDYRDARGRDKQDIDQAIAFYFVRNQDVYVLTTVGDIAFSEPDSLTADVRVYVAMAGQPISGGSALGGLRADLFEFDVIFADEGDDAWKVVSAEWRRAEPNDFLDPGE